MASPAVSAWVVAHLCFEEAGDHGDYAVDVALLRHARFVHQLGCPSERFLGERVGLGRRDEVGDGALEEQLPGWVNEVFRTFGFGLGPVF